MLCCVPGREYQGGGWSLVGAAWVLFQVLLDHALQGFELAALHLKGLVDHVVSKAALQVDL